MGYVQWLNLGGLYWLATGGWVSGCLIMDGHKGGYPGVGEWRDTGMAIRTSGGGCVTSDRERADT